MSKTKFDFGIMFKSAILLVIMIFPLSYVHEFGHAMVCSSEGFDFKITVDENGLYGKVVEAGTTVTPVRELLKNKSMNVVTGEVQRHIRMMD